MVEPGRALIKPSYMSVFLQLFFDDTELASGTGFLANSPSKRLFLLTARHNLTGRDQSTGQPLSSHGGVPNMVRVWHCPLGMDRAWISRDEMLHDGDGNPRWVEHPAFGADADVVGLPLENLQGTFYSLYMLQEPRARIHAGVAEPVSVVGFPFGLKVGGSQPVWATGFIASEFYIDFDNKPQFLIDCRARQGQSGSPVILYRHSGTFTEEVRMGGGIAMAGAPVWRLLGLYSGRLNRESDLGIVWRLDAIRDLIAKY